MRILDLEGADGGYPLQKKLGSGRRPGFVRNFLRNFFTTSEENAKKIISEWQEKRKHAVSIFLPSICYLTCPILLYVDSQPCANESWAKGLLSFSKNSYNSVGGPKPVLIVIKNRATEFDDPSPDFEKLCDIKYMTSEYQTKLEEKLTEIGATPEEFMQKFSGIHYIPFPHRSKRRDLFLKQRQQLTVS